MFCAKQCRISTTIAKRPKIRFCVIRIHNLGIIRKYRFLANTSCTLSVINYWQCESPHWLYY